MGTKKTNLGSQRTKATKLLIDSVSFSGLAFQQAEINEYFTISINIQSQQQQSEITDGFCNTSSLLSLKSIVMISIWEDCNFKF